MKHYSNKTTNHVVPFPFRMFVVLKLSAIINTVVYLGYIIAQN